MSSKTSKKSKSVRSGSSSRKSRNMYDYYQWHENNYGNNNVFARDECESSKAGGKYNTPAPTGVSAARAPAPMMPSSEPTSGDGWSMDDGGSIPTVRLDGGSADDPAGVVSKNDSNAWDDKGASEKDQMEESSTKSRVDKAFGSSAAMYGVLAGGVVVAVVALLLWKRPDPAFMHCGKSKNADEQKNMVIALVNKDLTGS